MFFRPFIHLILFSAASAWAGSVSLSGETAADYALRHNPSLAAARLRIEEARGRFQHSGRLGNPELELEFTRHTDGPESSAGIALTQRFPLTARLRHEKAVSRAELAAAEAEVRDAERRLAADVRSAAVKLLALRGQRELRREQLDHTRELSDFLRKRAVSGEASGVDAAQVDLESRQLEVENLTLDAEEAALLAEARTLLGIAGDEGLTITGTLPAPQRVPSVRDVAGRPDLQAAQFRTDAARAAVQEQRARRFEDFGIGASYSRDRTLDEPGPVETEHVLGLRFSVPLPLWNNNAGRVREAEAAAVRAEKEADAATLAAQAEVRAALGAMSAAAALISKIDAEVLPAATRIEDQLRASYSTGQTPLTDVLRARTRRLELQRQRLDALRDYHLARVRHSAAIHHPSPSQ